MNDEQTHSNGLSITQNPMRITNIIWNQIHEFGIDKYRDTSYSNVNSHSKIRENKRHNGNTTLKCNTHKNEL